MYPLVMENEINLSATESQTLTLLEWVKVRQAIESKMEELDSAAQWAEEKGYDSESYYRNEYAVLSAILKKMAKWNKTACAFNLVPYTLNMENNISFSTLIECRMALASKKENLEALVKKTNLKDHGLAHEVTVQRLREVSEALAEVEAVEAAF